MFGLDGNSAERERRCLLSGNPSIGSYCSSLDTSQASNISRYASLEITESQNHRVG